MLLDSQEILAEDYNVNVRKFNEGLNSKVKLSLYKSFCKKIEFKNYLQGVGDPGAKLMFKFRSGTNGLNKELGRQG